MKRKEDVFFSPPLSLPSSLVTIGSHEIKEGKKLPVEFLFFPSFLLRRRQGARRKKKNIYI